MSLILGLFLSQGQPLLAARPFLLRTDPTQATSSAAAREEAIQSIPFDRLDAAGRAKVTAVLDNTTVYRRMPTRVVCTDPDLYLFLVRHPDVIVNVWEALGVSQLQLRQAGPASFRVTEKEGTSATLQFLYRARDMHVIYGDWNYTGALMNRPVTGRCLAILKTGYLRESDGRCYVTSRLDAFLSVEPGGIEVLAKIFHPLVAKTADANFTQTVAFVGSLSRTAEVNSRGVQRLATKLTHISPEVRQQFAEITANIKPKLTATMAESEAEAEAEAEASDLPRLAVRQDDGGTR
jgi:hypothetical protein